VAALHRAICNGAHPLHFRCQEGYCLLVSACRAAAGASGDGTDVTAAAAYALASAAAADALVAAGACITSLSKPPMSGLSLQEHIAGVTSVAKQVARRDRLQRASRLYRKPAMPQLRDRGREFGRHWWACQQQPRVGVSAGETAVIGAAGRQWLNVARLLCDCLALGLQRRTQDERAKPDRASPQEATHDAVHDNDDEPDRAAKRQRVFQPERSVNGHQQAARSPQESDGKHDKTRHLGDAQGKGCSSQQLPSWHRSLAQLRGCQRAWRALIEQLRATEPRQGCEDAAQAISWRGLELLDTLGRTADLNVEAEPGCEFDGASRRPAFEEDSLLSCVQQAVAKEASGCSAVSTCQLQGLAVAAVHAVSRAAALLALCVGPTHVLREANAFGSCFGRLPWSVASAIVVAADELTH